MLGRCVFLITLTMLLATGALANTTAVSAALEALAVREARFIASQGNYFDAISRLDNEPNRHESTAKKNVPPADPFRQPESARIDFKLSYRLHLDDIQSTLSGNKHNIDQVLRNKFLFRLAKIYYRAGQVADALDTINRVGAEVPPELEPDLAFFRARVLMANGLYGEAITNLENFKKTKSFLGITGFDQKTRSLLGFTGFNLGVAHLLNDNIREGRQQLDLAGQIAGKDELTRSIRDKANLLLGEQLLMNGSYQQAGLALDRVRLEGPFSNPALLSAGWTSALQGNYKQALVPWTLLAERHTTDAPVQEALLAVPYSYGKLGIYSKAAPLYGRAVETFEAEIDRLHASIASIRDGRFVDALGRDEIRQDRAWAVKLRNLPDMPETYYLLDLIASHRFQKSLSSYLDLAQLREKLIGWEHDLQTYEELIEKRRAYYEPLLPGIDSRYKELDLRIGPLLEKRDKIGRRLELMKKNPRPDLFATDAEKNYFKEIDRIDLAMQPYHVVKTRARIDRLRGLLFWTMYMRYEKRLAATSARFERLNDAVRSLQKQQQHFALLRRAATGSFSGYSKPINTLREQIEKALGKTESTMSLQGQKLADMAETELAKRLEKLQAMLVKARFAMAESYDRAAVNRASGGAAR